jgi:hypothetical protein
MSPKTRKPVAAAERMRLLRTRRRNGLRCLRVTLTDTEIDCLVAKGSRSPSAVTCTLQSRAPLMVSSATCSALSKTKRPDLQLRHTHFECCCRSEPASDCASVTCHGRVTCNTRGSRTWFTGDAPARHAEHKGAQVLEGITNAPIQPTLPVRQRWSIPRRLIYGLLRGVHEPPNRVHFLPQRGTLAAGDGRTASVLAKIDCFDHLPVLLIARSVIVRTLKGRRPANFQTETPQSL